MKRIIISLLLFVMLGGVARAQDAPAAAFGAKIQHALQLYRAGQREAAVAECREAQRMAIQLYGADSQQAMVCLMLIGRAETDMGQHAQARSDLQQAYQTSRQRLGDGNKATIMAQILLGDACFHGGDDSAAEPLLSDAFNKPSPNDDIRLLVLLDLVALYAKQEDVVKIRPVLEELVGNVTPRLAAMPAASRVDALLQFGNAYHAMGDYARTESFLQQAWEQSAQLPAPTRAPVANALVHLYTDIIDFHSAEDYLLHAKELETGLPSDHRAVLETLAYEAELATTEAKQASAEQKTQQLHRGLACAQLVASTIRQQSSPSSDAMLEALVLVVTVQLEQRDFTAAAQTFGQIKQISAQRKLSTAEQANLDERLGWYNLITGQPRQALVYLQRAADFIVLHRGATAPDAALMVLNEAAALHDMGDNAGAARLVKQAQQAQKQSLADVLSFTSEQQRLDYVASVRDLALVGYLTLHLDGLLADALLEYKGLVLDSIVEDERAARKDPELQAALRQLDEAKVQRQKAENAHDTAGLNQANSKINEIEQHIARRTQGSTPRRGALEATAAQVAHHLPPHAVLLEYLHYHRYTSKGNYENGYGAMVISPDGTCHWQNCGAEDEVRTLIARYRRLVRGGGGRNTDSAPLLQALQQSLWAPLEKLFPPGTTQVIISPDEQLCFVSYATLLYPDKKFVCEKYRLYYVASGRDLLGQVPVTTSHEAALFGAPDYNFDSNVRVATSGDNLAMRGAVRDMGSLLLAALPGTAVECQGIAPLLRGHGENTDVFLGRDATEQRLREVAQGTPRILHLATHGFFLANDNDNGGNGTAASHVSIDAMDRSGLALAGAQTTLKQWQQHVAPAPDSDGILTAAEVALLPLRGTWLVTLSACDTGLGESASGEGVIGLRRGFVEAGVRHLLMTLWPVADEETAHFMHDFYEAAEKINNPADALAEVQRQWLVRLRDTTGLTDAVQIAGPFLISSQGELGQ